MKFGPTVSGSSINRRATHSAHSCWPDHEIRVAREGHVGVPTHLSSGLYLHIWNWVRISPARATRLAGATPYTGGKAKSPAPGQMALSGITRGGSGQRPGRVRHRAGWRSLIQADHPIDLQPRRPSAAAFQRSLHGDVGRQLADYLLRQRDRYRSDHPVDVDADVERGPP